jgi:cell division protein FtsW (lipid II flippase)
MSPGDVDAFLFAKRQIRWLRYATGAIFSFGLILLVVAIVSRLDIRWVGVLFSTVVCTAVLSLREWMVGPRDRLLDIVERQINGDPEALRYLASRRMPN